MTDQDKDKIAEAFHKLPPTTKAERQMTELIRQVQLNTQMQYINCLLVKRGFGDDVNAEDDLLIEDAEKILQQSNPSLTSR